MRRKGRLLSSAVVFAVLLTAGPGTGLAQRQAASATPFGKPAADVPNPGVNNRAVRAARPVGYQDQTRSEVLARNGIAATSNPLATAAAERVLLKGGNAIDAAVAASATLGVVEPMSTGMGGDLFAIVWSAKDRKLYSLASSGWAPRAWTADYFTDTLGLDEVPGSGINSAVVPGTVSGWDALLKRFGSMGFKDVLEPAASYAEQGFPLHERMHGQWRSAANALSRDADSARTWLPGGKAPDLYSVFRNPEMAHTLRLIQKKGRDAFYKGEIARAIVAKSEAAGGVMALDDLAKYQSEWVTPLSAEYHGYEVHQLPPPGQGFAALEMLNVLDVCAPVLGLDLAQLGPRDPRYWHLLIEAKKLAYSDLHRHNADPKFAAPPLDRLLSKEYAATLCDRIDPDRATPVEVEGSDMGSTVYFATADRWGNMVSLVNSNYSDFGSKVTIPGHGFVLANRGAGFTLEENHPNVVEPRKRPFITIIASFITKDRQPVMAFGNMGGGTQPQAHAQHIINMIDLGMNVQATTDVARFDHSQDDDVTDLDTYLFDLVGPKLQEMGHQVDRARGHAGGYQGILFEPDPRLPRPILPTGDGPRTGEAYERPVNGVYRAGSDPRKDGHAGGW
ncbi:gamma-glutamyltransferase [Microtetraspora sp. NBRC 13810]|uniref:gamma-glutamyltransferase n=1 Tax=Microtetraspora sp. NBRC 13810 TaxID=3030990 RepID=UPI0024A0C617|nr:gamma-glutamyltransferase [Microtetraspora sp. NBRC 13810]GLW09448.1 gamma-glutamyltransferase [Microtetraspora sp. NBRC 13810]